MIYTIKSSTGHKVQLNNTCLNNVIEMAKNSLNAYLMRQNYRVMYNVVLKIKVNSAVLKVVTLNSLGQITVTDK